MSQPAPPAGWPVPCHSACWGQRSEPGAPCSLRALGSRKLSQEPRGCIQGGPLESLRHSGEPWAGSLASVSSLAMRLTVASHPQGSWAVLDAPRQTSQNLPAWTAHTIVGGQRKSPGRSPFCPHPGCWQAFPGESRWPAKESRWREADRNPRTLSGRFPSEAWRGQADPGQGAGLLWGIPTPRPLGDCT